MKLTPKLTLTFVFFAAALLGIVNALVYNSGQNALEAAAIAELESIAGEKQAALNTWFEDRRSDIQALADDPALPPDAQILATIPANNLSFTLARDRVARDLQLRVMAGEFQSLMLLDPHSGKILVSTDLKAKGRPKDTPAYFGQAQKETYLTPVYYSVDLQTAALTAAAPVFSRDGVALGVLVGRINLAGLNEIVQRRSGLHQTDDAFLINASHEPVTQPRFQNDPAVLQQKIYTVPVNRCLEQKSGSVFANDYQGVPVIAVYRWLPERQMCLIVNISQTEALAKERTFGIQSIWIGLIALLIASVVAVGLSHTIIRPLRVMQSAAQHYGQGDLTIRLTETGADELGSLAHEFNTMAASLAKQEDLLRDYSLGLEQRVAERTTELAQSEERYRSLFENMLSGYAYCQMIFEGDEPQDFIYLEVNRAFESLTGLKEVEGRRISEIIPGIRAANPELFEAYGRVSLTGHPERFETFLRPLNLWFWISVYSPQQNYFVAVFDNITERKLDEAALTESEEKFKYIFDHSVVGKSITHMDGTLAVNQAFCDMLGYSREELLGTKWQEITHPEDIESSNRVVEVLISGEKESLRFTKRYLHKDGSIVWGDVSLSLRRDPQGKPLYFMTSVVDITERKLAEIKLAESLEFTERILTSSPVGIFTYNLSGECLSANAAAAEMVGGTISQIQSQNFHNLESWKRSGLYALAMQTIQTRKPCAEDIHHFSTFGRDSWYRVQFALFRAGGEDLLLMMFSDITDRKQAEAALTASERRFRTWIEHTSDILTVMDASGIIQYESPSVKRLLGYEPEELLGKNPFEFVHPEDRDRLLAMFVENIQHVNASVSAEYRFRHKDGSWRFMEALGHAFVDEFDEVVALIHSRDITERRKAEAALRASEERFRGYFEMSLVGLSITSPTKALLEVNDQLCTMLGFTREELLQMDWTMITHPDDLDSNFAQFNRILAGEIDSYSLEKRFLRKDGQTLYTTMSVNCSRREDRSVDYLMALLEDITDRKRAEEGLKEKERLLSQAQHIGQIGSLRYDIEGDRFQFSEEMYRLLDVSPEMFRHDRQDFLALIYPSDRPEVATWFLDLREGWQVKALDFRLFRKNGELRYLHCNGALEFNADGKAVRFVGNIQDVTERKLAEIQINQQIKHLTALSEIDRAIISGLDQHETLEVILSQILAQLQVDAADILLLNSNGQNLRYAAGQGFHTALMEKINVPLGKSFAGRIVKERRLLRVPNLREQVNDPLFDILVTEEKFVSYFGVPLVTKKEIKGVLEVFHRIPFQPYQEWLDFLETLAGQATIAIENANLLGNLKGSNAELSQAYDATLEGWSHAMDLRDKETEGHTQRVTELTLQVARAMGIIEPQLTHIRRGALLHDIGKLGIPDQILFKPGTLTAEEWEIMQKHPEYAYEMLSSIHYLKPALSIPYFHHEKWDGSGYPVGLHGEHIPLEARIFSVVDVWDALLSDRPYRKAWTVERTLEHIRALAGSHFDPNVVECFIRIMKP